MTYEERQLLRLFTNIQQKCYNPKDPAYPKYGGKGIRLCAEWLHNAKQFIADVSPRPSPRHTITLKHWSKDFSPDNVRWIDIAKARGSSHGQRGDLTDDQVLEVLRQVHDEGVPINALTLGFPASARHLRDIALGRARVVPGYPYPARLYEKRTEEQIAKEEALEAGLWNLIESLKEFGVTMSDVLAHARSLRTRKAPKVCDE